MKKYYIHNGTESSGPFDIEELKVMHITTKTPIWFEGMLHWKNAGEIPELNQLFIVNPPEFPPFLIPKATPKAEENKVAPKILGLSQSSFFILFAAIVIAVGITVLNTIQENRRRELELKNHKTEIENYQLELKQKQFEEEKIQAVIQEKINADREAKALSENASNRLSQIAKLIADYQKNLDETEKKLQKASDFKLLRSDAEKNKEIDLLQKNIDSFTNALYELNKESDQLKLELEKTQK
jgi:hypothetical protein